MKAEIVDGILEFTPVNKTEEYAIEQWFEHNYNGCTAEVNGRHMQVNHRKYHSSFKFRIQLWLFNHKLFYR